MPFPRVYHKFIAAVEGLYYEFLDKYNEACNSIAGRLFNHEPAELCVEEIIKFNGLVLKNLPLNEGVIPGEIRKNVVGVGRYRAVEPEDCIYLLKRLCDWLNHEIAGRIWGRPLHIHICLNAAKYKNIKGVPKVHFFAYLSAAANPPAIHPEVCAHASAHPPR